ncbi:MAG TPA: chromate transporter [Burkholderiales bacterium]|nr:chromate transporter [Burkholderiales bacterium]
MSQDKVIETHAARVGAWDLFSEFARLTLHSFGGALFWSRRMLVEHRRWLTEREFVEMLSLAQLLPGANGVNLAVLVGYRFAGLRGAAASLAGFVGAPLVIIIGIGALYQQFGSLALVKDALSGMSSVAVGLLIATAAKLTVVLHRRWLPWSFVLVTLVGIGVMRWPLLIVVFALAPFAIAAAWKGRL